MENFRILNIGSQVLESIKEHGFENPSEIQEKTIPLVLEGRDVIAGASTGSGKTLVFGSAIIEYCKKDFGVQALVLTPTRELAEQVGNALKAFSKYKPLNITKVYGGVSINPQIDNLENAEVVVGTPGRILDHISRGTIDLSFLKILVLDEADRMLDMGFLEDVEKIINICPKNRQTMLFSATISPDIYLIAKKYMKNPIEISANQYVDPSKLTQIYYDIGDNLKYSLLLHLLKNEKSRLAMVFCNTRRNVDFVSSNLKAHGINALPMHGGFSQEKRNRIIEDFHSQKTKILVCTDVAARGLDIKGVSHIYNFDIPKESKEYIHRIGRTARAGKEGKVINILGSRDYENFRNVLKDPELKITKEEPPYIERKRIDFMPRRKTRSFGRFKGRSRNGYKNNEGFGNRGRNKNENRNSGGRYNSNKRFGDRFRKRWR